MHAKSGQYQPALGVGFFVASIVLLILSTATIARAQQDNFYEYGHYHWTAPLPTPRGFVDASNGNLHIEIPIASIPERGHIPYAASLVYDSHIWQKSTTWQPTNVGGSWGGWRLMASDGTGGAVKFTTSQLKCRYFDGEIWGWEFYTMYSAFSWQAPDGHTINFSLLTHTGNDCEEDSPSGSSLDLQQWGYHINVTNYTQATIYAADGTQVYPVVEDTNGNKVNTMGGTPLSASTTGSTTTYTIANSANSSYQVVVTTESIPVDTAFGQSGVTEYSGNITVIQSVKLPDNSTYQFTYDQGSTSGHYGVLTGMTLPTGGQVTYSHSVFQNPWGERNLFINSCAWGGGTWTYTPAVVGSSCPTACSETVTVAKPNNSGSSDAEVHTFTYSAAPVLAFLDTQQQYYSGSSTLLKTVAETYSGDLPQSITTTLPMPSGSVSSQTQFLYDTNNFGNVVQKEEWGFYTGTPPSSPYRTTQYGYLANSDNNMVNKQSSVVVTAGGPTGAVEAETVISYDGSGLTSITGAFGHDDTNFGTGYTARGNPTQIQQYINGSSALTTSTMTYDTTGQALSIKDSNNNTTTLSYADAFYTDTGSNTLQSYSPSQLTNAYVTRITPPLNGATTLGYYYGSGRLATMTDQNSVSSDFNYDSWNRPIHGYLPAGGYVANAYTSATQVDVYKALTSSCNNCIHTQGVADSFGRPSESILSSDPDGATTSEVSYGTDGRVQTGDYPFRSGSTGSDSYSYDGIGRAIQITHGDSSAAKMYYGPQVTTVGGNASQTCSTSIYGIGYPILSVDEAGLKKQIWQDAFGRTIEVDSPDPANSNALDISTCYGYDYSNNLNGLNQNGQGRGYGHDLLGRLTSTNTPESGFTYFYYTTAGGALCSGDPTEVCRRVDAKNVTTTYTYDALNRLTGISYSDGTTHAASYSYDTTSCPVTGVSNYGKGRKTGMIDGSGSTSWCYDQAGRIVAEQRTIAGITKTTQYAYNLDGSLASITYPSGHVISYSVGNAERALSATDTTASINYAATASYAPQGAVASIIYGKVSGGFNGTTEQRAYNNRMELSALTASSTAGTAENLGYNYALPGGNNGSVSSITNNANTNLSESFSYDALSRILSAATQSNSASGCWGQSFGATGVPDDQWSNLTQMTGTQCSTGQLSVTANSSTNQISTSGYSYDADGNMTNDASYAYTYNAEGRIATANGVTYTYDGNGLRVEKSSGKLYWRDIFGDTIAETDSTGSTTNASYREYVFFAGRRIAQRDGLGDVNYYYADALGSTVTMTDGSGNACYETTYTPYGEEHATMTSCSTNYKFAGYEQDAETGLYYAFARYYNPRLGRFMTPDPLMGDIRNPQTLNRYAYVANNPLNLIDPSGLHEEDEGPPYTCVVGGNVIEGEDNCILAQLQADDPCGTGTGPCDSFGGGSSSALAPDKKALANCTKALFGVSLVSFAPSAPGENGSFTGETAGIFTGFNQPLAPGPSQFTVTNNVNKYSGSQLAGVAAANGQLQPGESIGGYTFFNNPYENYTANDLSSYNGGGGVPGGIPIPDPAFADLETQIFELGNSLAVLTDTVPQNVNSTPGPANTEPGTRLLNCFNKGGPKAGS